MIKFKTYRTLYLMVRKRTKPTKIAVCSGGRMSEEMFLKYSQIANELKNKNNGR